MRPRTIIRGLALVAAALVISVAAMGVFFMSSAGRDLFWRNALPALSQSIGQTVAIGQTGGAWPHDLDLTAVTLADREGVWLEIDNLRLTWRPTALLWGRVAVEDLRITGARLIRLPTDDETPAAAATPFDVYALRGVLARIKADAFAVEPLSIEPAVFGNAATVAIKGALKSENGPPLLKISLERRDEPGSAALELALGRNALSLDAYAAVAGINLDIKAAISGRAQTLSGTVRASCGGGFCVKWATGGLGEAKLDATLSGTGTKPAADVSFAVNGITTDGRSLSTFEGTVSAKPAGPGSMIRLEGRGTLNGLQSFAPEAVPLLGDDGTWTLAGGFENATLALENLTVTAGDTNASLAGTLSATVLNDITLTLDLRGAGRLAGLADDTSKTHATFKIDKGTFAPTITGSGTLAVDLENPPAQIVPSPAFGTPLKASTTFNLTPTRAQLTNLTAQWGPAILKGESTLTRDAAAIQHQTTSARLTVAPGAFPGQDAPLHAEAALNGDIPTLAASVTATLAEYQRGAARFAEASVTVQGQAEPQGWRGTLDAAATLNDAPVTLTSAFSRLDGALALRDLALTGAGINLAGTLQLAADNTAITGTIAGPVNDLAPWMTLAGFPATGRGQVALAFGGDTQDRITLTLETYDFASAIVGAENLKLTATVDTIFSGMDFTARATAIGGDLSGRSFDRLTATLDGDLQKINATLESTGTKSGRFLLSAAGNVTLNDATDITLSRLVLEDGGLKVSLPEPARLTITDDLMTLPPTRLAVGTGTVDARATIARKTDMIDAHLSFAAISIGDAKDVFSVGQTFIDGKVDISGQMTNADLTGALTARFQPNDGGAPITSVVNAQVHGGRATITGTASGLSSEDARLNADLPMTLDLSGPRLQMDMQASANAHLAWRGDIKPLWDMLGNEQHTLAGETDIDLHMTGTLGEPTVTGGVRLTKGLYENLAAGTALHNIVLDVTAHNSDAINLTLSATDTGAGTLKAQGTARKGDGPYAWTLEASGDLKQFHVLRRDDVTAAADGRITYQGTLRAGTLGGDLKIVRSELRLGESYQPEIPLLRGIAARGQTSGVSGIKLAITLSVPEVLRTEGKGLEAFWRGDIKVTGDINNPDLVGQLSLARGTFSFLGRTFDLSSGTVTFTGGGKIDPDLNVVAVRQAEDITATVTISGRASQPRITLSSQPALPQDEVLARLLFRKGATQLGPLETLQLANAAADLTGLSRGGLTGVLRRASGLDILDFGGASGNAIVVGTQLSNTLYVGIEQNVNDSSRRIVIEWRLTRQFSLQSTTTDKTGSDLGVLWRKNY